MGAHGRALVELTPSLLACRMAFISVNPGQMVEIEAQAASRPLGARSVKKASRTGSNQWSHARWIYWERGEVYCSSARLESLWPLRKNFAKGKDGNDLPAGRQGRHRLLPRRGRRAPHTSEWVCRRIPHHDRPRPPRDAPPLFAPANGCCCCWVNSPHLLRNEPPRSGAATKHLIGIWCGSKGSATKADRQS